MDREWTTNACWGNMPRLGYNRCACGNDKLSISCHSYKDGTHGFIASCWDCGRQVEIDGTEEDLRRAWNGYNRGAVKMTFRLVKVPETVTIYAKPEDDVGELIKDALFREIEGERI